MYNIHVYLQHTLYIVYKYNARVQYTCDLQARFPKWAQLMKRCCFKDILGWKYSEGYSLILSLLSYCYLNHLLLHEVLILFEVL